MASPANKTAARGAAVDPENAAAEVAAPGLASDPRSVAGKPTTLATITAEGDDASSIAAAVAAKSTGPVPPEAPEPRVELVGPGIAPGVPNDVAAIRRSDVWWVIDTTAKEGSRMHEPLAGVKYNLDANRWQGMPSAHAMVFLRDPAFTVKDDQHNTIAALPGSADIRVHRTLELQPGEIVAHIDELNTPALMARAVQYPGGARVNAGTERGALLQFLGQSMLTARNLAQRGPGDTSQGSGQADQVLEDADAAFVDRLLGPR